MVNIIENPESILTLKVDDVVRAGEHEYMLCSFEPIKPSDLIPGNERFFFDRCDPEWLAQSSRFNPDLNDYQTVNRHIRFKCGDAVGTLAEFYEAVVENTARFNC